MSTPLPSVDERRLKLVKATIAEIVAGGRTEFRPGDVASVHRASGDPIPVWELRAMFTVLQHQGYLVLDENTANWQLGPEAQSVAAG